MSARNAAVRAVAEALCRSVHGRGALTRRDGSCERCKASARPVVAALATSADVRAGLVAAVTDALWDALVRYPQSNPNNTGPVAVDAVLAALGGGE